MRPRGLPADDPARRGEPAAVGPASMRPRGLPADDAVPGALHNTRR